MSRPSGVASWFYGARQACPLAAPFVAEWGDLQSESYALVEQAGLVQGVDFDGLAIVYSAAQSGPFTIYGGWAGVRVH